MTTINGSTLIAGTYIDVLNANLATSQINFYQTLFPFNADPNSNQIYVPPVSERELLGNQVNSLRFIIDNIRQVKDLTGSTLDTVDNNLTTLWNMVTSANFTNAQDYYNTDIQGNFQTYYGF